MSEAATRTAGSWTPADIPDLSGLTALVTGANSGLGWHTADELARHGARVLMACRDAERGQKAIEAVRAGLPQAQVELVALDLADLGSVRRVAGELVGSLPRLDLLVNNAGVMGVPRRTTPDGFELQFGTNHLGHFALTGLLLPVLLRGSVPAHNGTDAAAPGPPRVITVSSTLHRRGRIDRDDLMGEHGYTPFGAYSQSKLANLLFTRELQRRADRAGVPLYSLAVHPGWAATNLQGAGPAMSGRAWLGTVMGAFNTVFAQSAEHGAWPTLRASTDPLARGGEYFGPGGFAEQRGSPKRVGMSARASDAQTAAWLWQRSVELTGVDYAQLRPA
jgi:NAD(P)-dependent dehydrogenase (short-subunit alcohol dehydrogenase family)